MPAYLVKVTHEGEEPTFEIVEAASAVEAVSAFMGGLDSTFEVWSLRTLEPRRYKLVTETTIQRA